MTTEHFDGEIVGHVSLTKQTDGIGAAGSHDAGNYQQTISGADPRDITNPGMQAVWEEASSKELSVPYKYQSVAVLIIHWAEQFDRELKCRNESRELHELFEKGFGFKSKVLELDTAHIPLIQIQHCLLQLIMDNNLDDTGACRSKLVIIYYSGHGVNMPERGLYLIGEEHHDPSQPSTNGHAPHASWNEAEEMLSSCAVDILTIMDCCSAGALWKGSEHQDRAWEVLAAAGREDPTAAPGPKSFSRALIDCLKVRLRRDELFTVWQLHDDIMKQRGNDRSIFKTRHGVNNRYIKLSRMDSEPAKETKSEGVAASMTLRLSFEDRINLTNAEVIRLAKAMARGASRARLGIKKLDMVEFKATKDPAMVSLVRRVNAVRTFQRLCRGLITRNKLKREREEDRKDAQEKEDFPAPKRQQLEAPSIAPPQPDQYGHLSPSPSDGTGHNSPLPPCIPER